MVCNGNIAPADETLTVALLVADVVEFVHVSVKVVVELSTPVETPTALAVASDPLHPSEAVQLVASVLFQVNVDASPLVTLGGVAVKVTVGTGGAAVTVTAVLAAAEPPAPEHVSV